MLNVRNVDQICIGLLEGGSMTDGGYFSNGRHTVTPPLVIVFPQF